MDATRFIIFTFVAVLCSLILEGCEFNVPRHEVGNWEAKPSYLVKYDYAVPGTSSSILNSCSDTNLTSALQCNGHGHCRDYFSSTGPSAPKLAFCDCDTYWADPECRTPRKSQVTAFVLSMFLGVFGADQFYLGYPWYGALKLITLGGGGLWYLYDLCRIGSSTVLTKDNFRVAADLPHFAFVLSVVTAMLFFGFLFSILSIMSNRYKKAHEVMMIRMQAEEEPKVEEPPRMPTSTPLKPFVPFSGYGTTIPSAPITITRSSSRIITASPMPTVSAVGPVVSTTVLPTVSAVGPVVSTTVPMSQGILPAVQSAPGAVSSSILPTSSVTASVVSAPIASSIVV